MGSSASGILFYGIAGDDWWDSWFGEKPYEEFEAMEEKYGSFSDYAYNLELEQDCPFQLVSQGGDGWFYYGLAVKGYYWSNYQVAEKLEKGTSSFTNSILGPTPQEIQICNRWAKEKEIVKWENPTWLISSSYS